MFEETGSVAIAGQGVQPQLRGPQRLLPGRRRRAARRLRRCDRKAGFYGAFKFIIDSAYISAAPAVAAGVSCTAHIVAIASLHPPCFMVCLTAVTVAASPMSVSVPFLLWSQYELPNAAHAMPA